LTHAWWTGLAHKNDSATVELYSLLLQQGMMYALLVFS